MNAVYDIHQYGHLSLGTYTSLLTTIVTPFVPAAAGEIGSHINGEIGQVIGQQLGETLTTAHDLYTVISSQIDYYRTIGLIDKNGPRKTRTSEIEWLNDYYVKCERFCKCLEKYIDIQKECFGNAAWYMNYDPTIEPFTEKLKAYLNGEIDTDGLREAKPESITEEDFSVFIERINNTLADADAENKIDQTILAGLFNDFITIENQAKEQGYLSSLDMYNYAVEDFNEHIEYENNTVCSSITLQITQKMVMTRQAFRGTLTVFNGSQDTAMQDIRLNLILSNDKGDVATSHEFQINAESIDGFTGETDLDSGWSLEGNSTGTATILFIPTKYAAPDESVDWTFGGTLSYIDPFTGLEVTRELYPVTLTVKPSPNLELTYFMQRDVYGDDALTEVVEPIVPAEFALLVNNKGNGEATNVRMQTQQPEIIENEKGLLIDFELISSQVNGGDAALSFGKTIANDFGNIPAHSQMYAQWWLTSTLLGHFTSYKIEIYHSLTP